MKKTLLYTTAALASIWAIPAFAASVPANASSNVASSIPSLPSEGHFSVTPTIGTDFTIGGDFVKSGSQTVSNANLFGAAVTGTTTFSAGSQTFSNAYDVPIQIGLAANYGLTSADEVSANVRYMHASGKNFDALNVTGAGTYNGQAYGGSATFQGKFSDYNEAGLDAGYKHFFSTPYPLFHPYLGGTLGAVHNNNVKLDLSLSGTPVVTGIGFFNAGWTWSAGLQTGFRYDIASATAIGLETGIRYTGTLKQNTTDINTASAGGLSGVNGGGSRWDIPLVLGLTEKF